MSSEALIERLNWEPGRGRRASLILVESSKIEPRRPPLSILLLVGPYNALHRRRFRCTMPPAGHRGAEAAPVAYRTINFHPIYCV